MIQIPHIFEQGPKQESTLRPPYTTLSCCLEHVTNTPYSGEEVAKLNLYQAYGDNHNVDLKDLRKRA